ncbi:HD domain-containing protein [Nocardia uniformis]|uniref:HD domain-containing protein n=1 Tax=Nocardia uniformis TaxID=53432 RepID=A0A849C3K7_9NOCA|nr:HD domain-containing phosphohydrolase [Nocardia uniformis]NNH72348.1 HD domain-containing protein [Nocardia uniformis]
MPVQPESDEVRVAELLATLSLAADLGLGQPMEHCLRQTVIALRLADLAGAGETDREATYYAGLMANVYCHADATEQARWYGDDIRLKRDGFELLDMGTARTIAFLLRRMGSHGSPMQRARRMAAFPLTAQQRVVTFLNTHATLGSEFATRIGLAGATSLAIRQEYEQWDGKGYPERLRAEQISLPARVVHLAAPVEVYGRRSVESARTIARRHRGGEFDPTLVDLFCDHAPAILDGMAEAADWDAILDAEPGLSRTVTGEGLDAVLEAMADLIDLKSPYLAGHSRGVADLVAAAARVSGFSTDEVTTLRRAALIHDMGRLGVSNAIWDKPGPLTAAELERIRLHPYLTERMLARVSALGRSRDIAARHHERLDGSGYPRGLTAASLTPSDRLLAAADVYHALSEPRPHRPPLGPGQASQQLRSEVRAGRLDGEAVNAVLKAAGHRAPARREWPAGLTAREVEVLVLLARGHSNREIARRLGVTPKTVSNHVEHVYTKAAVSSRAAATLFATRHGLLGNFVSA